jgi:uncharacterized protein (TIGR02001 family)
MVALSSLPAPAEGEGFSATASVASDYAYRGYSKSNNSLTAKASVDYSHRSGWFVGGWAQRVDFGDSGYPNRSNVEFYPYAGYGFGLGNGLRGEVSVARYVFDGDIFGEYSDYNEYSAALHVSDWLSMRLNFSNDGYHRGGSILNGEVSGHYPLTADLAASAGVGYNSVNVSIAESTLYWNIGVTWYFKYLALDIRYVDTADIPAHAGLPPTSYTYTHTLPDLKQNFMGTLSVGF